MHVWTTSSRSTTNNVQSRARLTVPFTQSQILASCDRVGLQIHISILLHATFERRNNSAGHISARLYEWMSRALSLHLASKFPSNITFIPAGCQVWFLGDRPECEWSVPLYLTRDMLPERFLWRKRWAGLAGPKPAGILLQCVKLDILRLEMKTRSNLWDLRNLFDP